MYDMHAAIIPEPPVSICGPRVICAGQAKVPIRVISNLQWPGCTSKASKCDYIDFCTETFVSETADVTTRALASRDWTTYCLDQSLAS